MMTQQRHVILSMAAILMAVMFIGCSSEEEAAPPTTPPPAPVRIAEVVKQDLVPKHTLIGSVRASRRSVVGSAVAGRVTAVRIEDGDAVSAQTDESAANTGILVTLNTETIDSDIKAAQAEFRRLQEQLNELKTGSRPEEITRAKAEYDAAHAARDAAATRFARIEKLNEAGVSTADDFEAAKSISRAAEQRLKAAKADLELIEAGPRKEQIEQAAASVEKQSQILARLNVQRGWHTIRAPFDGFVVKRMTEVGQWVAQGDPIVEIMALDPIDVVVHAPESLVGALRPGDLVPVKVHALPDDEEELSGTIAGIVDSADQRARTFPVRVRVDNPQRAGGFLLRDGMQAQAVISGRRRSVLMIPKDALILGGRLPVVMVADMTSKSEGVAVRVEVETGIAHGELIEVTGQLSAGQSVIVDGNERLQPGQLVRVVED